MGGVIVDPTGQPLPSCKVILQSAKRRKTVSSGGGKALTWSETFDKKLVDHALDTTNTDAQGRFNLQAVQARNCKNLCGAARIHRTRMRDRRQLVDLVTLKVEKGVRVTGMVVDDHEMPVVGISVGCLPLEERNWHAYSSPRDVATTDNRGQFSLAPVAFGKYQVGVSDRRFVPIQVELSPDKPLAPVTFRPHPLATVRVNFVDRAGKPSAFLHPEISISGSMAKVPYAAACIGRLAMRMEKCRSDWRMQCWRGLGFRITWCRGVWGTEKSCNRRDIVPKGSSLRDQWANRNYGD